jgi:hypothetical protein
VTDSRPSPTVSELDQLREFVRVVDAMSRRRFIETFRRHDQSVSSDGVLTGPDYDREDFDAFLTDFRKVAMSDGERIYLTKVMKTVGKFASDSLRKELKELRDRIFPLLEGKVQSMTLGYEREERRRI